jgi:aminoglycoside/choline kinase family phosphotransferase
VKIVPEVVNQESEVTSRPIPDDLLPWALTALDIPAGGPPPVVDMVAGDASNRRYFRLVVDGNSWILAEAPPATEKNEAFVAIRELLWAAGVVVPALYAVDLKRGFLLLEDLGDSLLLPLLRADTVDHYYASAFDVLHKMAASLPGAGSLACYDSVLLEEELSRFGAWFAEQLLGYSLDAAEQAMLRRLFGKLVDNALEQPQVFVHRDFHSRNLMLQADGALAVIDFQDAVLGPFSYDLVSLLRDCYICWDAPRVQAWALAYRDRMCAAGLLADIDDAHFLRWFDWMGLQRHIKVLGTFARLYLRDGKSAYLDDLPLVISYVLEVARHYAPQEPAFAEFANWFEARLLPLIAAQVWGKSL